MTQCAGPGCQHSSHLESGPPSRDPPSRDPQAWTEMPDDTLRMVLKALEAQRSLSAVGLAALSAVRRELKKRGAPA